MITTQNSKAVEVKTFDDVKGLAGGSLITLINKKGERVGCPYGNGNWGEMIYLRGGEGEKFLNIWNNSYQIGGIETVANIGNMLVRVGFKQEDGKWIYLVGMLTNEEYFIEFIEKYKGEKRQELEEYIKMFNKVGVEFK